MIQIQAFLDTPHAGAVTLRGKVYALPTEDTFGLRDESKAVLIHYGPDFDKSKAAVKFDAFVRLYNPIVNDGKITLTANSAIFKTSAFNNLVDAPQADFPRVGCLEAATSAPVGIYKKTVVAKVVSKSAVRESKYGRLCKAVVKDVIGYR